MRVTGPTVRRRNHAWLQMRSLARRARALAVRGGDEDSADEADTSGDESDGGADSSGDEAENKPTQVVRPPAVTTTTAVGGGVTTTPVLVQPTTKPIPVLLPGVALGAEEGAQPEVESDSDADGIESDDDETTTPPAPPPNTTTPPPPPPPAATVTASTSTAAAIPPTAPAAGPPPPAVTSTRLPPQPILTLSTSSTSSIVTLVTSLTGPAATQTSALGVSPGSSTGNGASPTVPVTGSTQSEDPQTPPERPANELSGDDGLRVTPAPQNSLSGGAIAGIVIGLLAFIALLAGALLFWRKRRRAQGQPFLPFSNRGRDDSSSAASIGGPLPGRVGGPTHAKTNTQIMDDLMKAAYAADGGTNDMEGAYGYGLAISDEKFGPLTSSPPHLPPVHQPQQNTTKGPGFMLDETAYIALAGAPLTPATTVSSEKKPVMKWLTEVKTPTQPNGPEIPPTPNMPFSATMPSAGGRVPEPPRQAYFGRDTMTTDTTGTDVRWYG